MILLRFFRLLIGILIGLFLIPVLIISVPLLFGLCLLAPIWLPMAAIIIGAVLLIAGVIALLTPK
jgi:uncharacterized membrane protein